MREIKFRAWDKVEKSMFSVSTIAYLHGGIKISAPGHFIANNESEVWVKCKNDNNNEIKAVLMQYAGLKDKNGKEIYEGDIVEVTNPGDKHIIMAEVVWHNNHSSFAYRYRICGGKDYTDTIWNYPAERRTRKLGNVYENPNLLEKVNNGTLIQN